MKPWLLHTQWEGWVCSFASQKGSKHLSHAKPCNKGGCSIATAKGLGWIDNNKKYWSAFATQHNCETPQQLFQLVPLSKTSEERHEWWIEKIQEVVSERILSEDERIPSTSALHRHWARTCWVSQFWKYSIKQDVQQGLSSPQQSGWQIQSDGTYMFDWDSQELQERVKGTVEFLTKGCSCKKSKCLTSQCTCRRQHKTWGPGCTCRDCNNSYTSDQSDTDSEEEILQEPPYDFSV